MDIGQLVFLLSLGVLGVLRTPTLTRTALADLFEHRVAAVHDGVTAGVAINRRERCRALFGVSG